MHETFKYGSENDTYEKSNMTEKELFEQWKAFHGKHLTKIGPFDKKGRIPYGYILPKFKDLNKTRPIVSYYCHPLKRVLNIFARALSFILKSCTTIEHLTIWNTDALVDNIKLQTHQWIDGNKIFHVPALQIFKLKGF